MRKKKNKTSEKVWFRNTAWLTVLLYIILVCTPPTAHAAIFTGGSGKGDARAQGQASSDPAQLVFTLSPSSVAANQVFNPQPIVQIQDKNNNDVDPATECTITLLLYNNPSNATLGGTKTMTSVAGEADFSGKGLFVDSTGQLYTLKATARRLAKSFSWNYSPRRSYPNNVN